MVSEGGRTYNCKLEDRYEPALVVATLRGVLGDEGDVHSSDSDGDAGSDGDGDGGGGSDADNDDNDERSGGTGKDHNDDGGGGKDDDSHGSSGSNDGAALAATAFLAGVRGAPHSAHTLGVLFG